MRNLFLKRRVFLCVLSLCAMFALPASADIVAFDVPPQSGNDNGQCTVGQDTVECSYGLDFDVNAAIWVTGVGVFDPFAATGQPLIGPLTVGIYDRDTEAEIAGTFYTFPEGTIGPLLGGSLIHDLVSYVYLPIGHYSVVAWGYSADQMNGNTECNGGVCGGPSDPVLSIENDGGGIITFRASRFGVSGQYPTNPGSGPSNQYLAGTFTYIPAEEEQQPETPAVPEPATIALVAPAVLGLIRKLKR